MNAIFKTIKKQIKSHRSADIKKGIQSLQLSNDPKRWITLKKEMGYPRIGNTQKMKFSITDFFTKCDQIRTFPRIWSHLLKKSVMENFLFCAVREFICGPKKSTTIAKTDQDKLKQFAEQLKSVFATKIELKDKDLEREIGKLFHPYPANIQSQR